MPIVSFPQQRRKTLPVALLDWGIYSGAIAYSENVARSNLLSARRKHKTFRVYLKKR